MDWYLSRYAEDGVVPKDLWTLEQICEDEPLSLDDWPQNEFENFVSPKERFNSGNVRDEQEFLWDRPDYQLQKWCQNCPDQMEEKNFNSLANEDHHVVENPYNHEDLNPDFQSFSGSFGNLLAAMVSDNSSTPKDLSTFENEYTRTSKLPFNIFEETDMWDEKDCSPSVVEAVTAELLFNQKVPMLTIQEDTELNVSTSMSSGLREHENSEESVLDELEFVLKQLNDETRICFRDALYRLAKSSRQRSAEGESRWDKFNMEIPSFATVDGQSPCRSSEVLDSLESETNVIDRSVINLLFNKVIFAYSDVSSLPSS